MLDKYKSVPVGLFIKDPDIYFAHVQHWNTAVGIDGGPGSLLGVMLRNDTAWNLMKAREAASKCPKLNHLIGEPFLFLDRWTMTLEEFYERGVQKLNWLNTELPSEPHSRRRSIIITANEEFDEDSPRCEIFREVDALELIRCQDFHWCLKDANVLSAACS